MNAYATEETLEIEATRKAKKDAAIEEKFDAFMTDVLDNDYDGDFSEYGFSPEVEDEDELEDEAEVATETTETPAVPPLRVFEASRQRFVSKKQESYSNNLAMEIRDRLFAQFNEDLSAHYFHKNFTIDQLLAMLKELRAGRNFDVE